jgi:PAS domain S-box-containing protein
MSTQYGGNDQRDSDQESNAQALVLIVDDDDSIRQVLRIPLEFCGYRVEEAENGIDALELYSKFSPAVVLLDAMMPVIDGFEVCSRIRAMPDGQTAAVVMVTGIEDPTAVDRAFEAGAIDFITKPVNVDVLIHRVRRLIIARRAEEYLQRSHDELEERVSERTAELAEANEALQAEILERRKLEEKLTQERNVLRTLLDHLPDYIFTKDREGRFVVSNEAHAHSAHVPTADDLVGKTAFDLYPPDLAAQYDADDEAVMASGQALINLERVSLDSAGNRRWVSTIKVPLRDAQGEVVGLVGISRDITERKATETALLESEAAEREQRTLAEALRDIAVALTSTLDPNVVMERILDNIGRVIPHDAAEIMLIELDAARIAYWRGYPASMESFLLSRRFLLSETANLHQMLSTGRPYLVTDTTNDPNWLALSEASWVRAYIGAPIRAHGQIIGFLNLSSTTPGFFSPVHLERLQALADQAAIAIHNAQLYDELRRHARTLEEHVEQRTAELRQVKERVETILNNSSDAIIVTRLDGTISQANPAFQALFGYPADDAIYQPALSLAEPDHAALLGAALAAVREENRPQRLEMVARRRDGTTFNADIALAPITEVDIRRSGLDQSGVVLSIRDITELKRVEKELQDLNRLKTEFLSTAAHELRTPLTSVRGFSEILLNRSLDPDRQHRYLTLIHHQSIQLGQLIDDLLDLARLEATRSLTLDLQAVDMAKLLQEVVTPFIEASAQHHIRLEGLEEASAIRGDPVRLSQVLRNLLSNAIKYSPEGGTVYVRCRALPDALEVSVQDQGIGMTTEQQGHLFEKFYRADASNTAISGTGLGLAISRFIVELHGGAMRVDSSYGVGTTVSLTLPLSKLPSSPEV